MAKAPKKSAKKIESKSKKTASKAKNASPKVISPMVVSAAAAKSRTTSTAKTSGGGVQPMTISPHTYKVNYAPSSCDDYSEGDLVDVYVSDPPPQKITLMPGGDCDGTILLLDE